MSKNEYLIKKTNKLRNYGICIDWNYEYIRGKLKCYKRVKCISIIFDKVGMFNINKNLYDVNSLDDLVIE